MSHIVDYDEEPGSRRTRRPRPDDERILRQPERRSPMSFDRPRDLRPASEYDDRSRPDSGSFDTATIALDTRQPRRFDSRQPASAYDALQPSGSYRSYDTPRDSSRESSMRVYDEEPGSRRFPTYEMEPRGARPKQGPAYDSPSPRPEMGSFITPPSVKLEEGAVMQPPRAKLEEGATMQPPKKKLETGIHLKPPTGRPNLHSTPVKPADLSTSVSTQSPSLSVSELSTVRQAPSRTVKPVKGPPDSDSETLASRASIDLGPRSDRFRTSSDFDRLDRSRDSDRGHVNGSFDGSYDRSEPPREPQRPFVRDLDYGRPRSSFERAREDAYIERLHDKERHEQRRRESYDIYSETSSDTERVNIHRQGRFLCLALMQVIFGLVVSTFAVILTQLPAWSRHYGAAIFFGAILAIIGAIGLLTRQTRDLTMVKWYQYSNYFGVVISLLLLAYELADVTESHGMFYHGYFPYILTPDGPLLYRRFVLAQLMMSLIILLILLGPFHLFVCLYQIHVCKRTRKGAERPVARIYDANRPPRNDPVLQREHERVTYISTQSLV